MQTRCYRSSKCSLTGGGVCSVRHKELWTDGQATYLCTASWISRVLKTQRALQWDPQVCSFSEEKLKTVLLLSECKLCGLSPHPPDLLFLVSQMANPRLDKEVTSYHDCFWQTAASHCVRLINKCTTHKTEQQRFTQRWIWPLRPCHALTYNSDVLGSAGSKEAIWSIAVYDICFETFSGTAAWQTQLVFNKEMLIIYRCISNKSSWHSNSEFL